MKLYLPVLLVITTITVSAQTGETLKARQLESSGEALEARSLLQKAVQERPSDPEALSAYAEFLDRHRDPGARSAYEKLLQSASGPQANVVAKRLVLLDLLANDKAAALRHL